jgi:hypothetical protein
MWGCNALTIRDSHILWSFSTSLFLLRLDGRAVRPAVELTRSKCVGRGELEAVRGTRRGSSVELVRENKVYERSSAFHDHSI